MDLDNERCWHLIRILNNWFLPYEGNLRGKRKSTTFVNLDRRLFDASPQGRERLKNKLMWRGDREV